MIEDFRKQDKFTDHRTFVLYCLVSKKEDISISAYHFCADMVKHGVIQEMTDNKPLDFSENVVRGLADSVHEHWVQWRTNKSDWEDMVCTNL